MNDLEMFVYYLQGGQSKQGQTTKKPTEDAAPSLRFTRETNEHVVDDTRWIIPETTFKLWTLGFLVDHLYFLNLGCVDLVHTYSQTVVIGMFIMNLRDHNLSVSTLPIKTLIILEVILNKEASGLCSYIRAKSI